MLKFFPNSEGKHEGDVFEYPDPSTVVREGLAELVIVGPIFSEGDVSEHTEKKKKGGKK